MSPPLLVVDAAESFWAEARMAVSYPRDIRRAIARSQPIAIVLLPALRVSNVEDWLQRQGRPVPVDVGDRPLRACLVAQADNGIIFVDGADSENEQRFSIAHELAHFLLDYESPRRAAVARHGKEVLEVLDGLRPARDQERIAALLTGVPVRRHVHLMGRHEDLSRAGEINQSETLADALALELLAPWEVLRREIQEAGIGRDRRAIARLLVTHFGLPEGQADRYAAHLSPDAAPSSALLRHLRSVELSPPARNITWDEASSGVHMP